MKSSADAMLAKGDPVSSYEQYGKIFDLVRGQKVKSQSVQSQLDQAKKSMEFAYAQAAPLIQKKEQEEAARAEAEHQEQERRRQAEIAAAQQAELERQQREAEQKRAAAARKAEEDAARLAAVERVKRQTARALSIRSDAMNTLKRQSDEVVADLTISLAGEDSAYRGMSKRSKAARQLLALYTKAEGQLAGTDVSADVDQFERAADVDVAGEDSAIRALYENDRGFLNELGPLCRLLSSSHPEAAKTFDSEHSKVSINTAGDHSAPRAIMECTGASMHVLAAIDSTRGSGMQSEAIVSSIDTSNIAEDSAWRATMRSQEGCSRVLLDLIAQESPQVASRIQGEMASGVIGEDSAFRAIETNQQATIDALHWLIQNP